jgi:hypothetical protein
MIETIICLLLLLIGIGVESEILIIASGLYAIAANLSNLIK